MGRRLVNKILILLLLVVSIGAIVAGTAMIFVPAAIILGGGLVLAILIHEGVS